MYHTAAKSKTTTFPDELQMWLIEIFGREEEQLKKNVRKIVMCIHEQTY